MEHALTMARVTSVNVYQAGKDTCVVKVSCSPFLNCFFYFFFLMVQQTLRKSKHIIDIRLGRTLT